MEHLETYKKHSDFIWNIAQVLSCRRRLIFSDKTYRVHIQRNMVVPEFFVPAMMSKYVREQIELSIALVTAAVASKIDVRNDPIPKTAPQLNLDLEVA